MNICFISFEHPPNILGGSGIYSEAVVNGLKRKGMNVFVITRGAKSDLDQKIYRVPSSNVPYWRRLFFMKPAITLSHKLHKLFEFDIVHFNEPYIILGKPELPTVCTFHSSQVNEINMKRKDPRTLKTLHDIKDLLLKSPVGSVCDFLTAHATDRIICPSPHLAKLIKSYCMVDEQKIWVVPNGIDLETINKIKTPEADALSRYNLEKDNYVLFMGRLSVLKGVQYLIKVFRTINADLPKLKLAIVGTGPFETYLRNLAHGMDNVTFVGYLNSLQDKKLLYENSLAVVVPSIYEGLPMVVLEAMAFGKVVIASDVGGVPLLIRHRKNGFLVKPRDSQGIERYVKTLYGNKNLRKTMGLSGRKIVERKFTVDKMVSKTLGVYKSLV